MQMTPSEIRRNYREAADKNRQIGILADLNCTTKAEIIRILETDREVPYEKPKNFNNNEHQMRSRMSRLSEDELTEQYVRHMNAIHIIADTLAAKVEGAK